MDAIDRMQYDMPQAQEESDEEDPELGGADSEALRAHIVQLQEERRVEFVANSDLQHARRSRGPSHSS